MRTKKETTICEGAGEGTTTKYYEAYLLLLFFAFVISVLVPVDVFVVCCKLNGHLFAIRIANISLGQESSGRSECRPKITTFKTRSWRKKRYPVLARRLRHGGQVNKPR